MDRIIPNINRAFALLHERKLRQFLEQIAAQNTQTKIEQIANSIRTGE